MDKQKLFIFHETLDFDILLTYCRLSLRLVNKSPEDIIFTSFFQESFPSVYNFDTNKPRVELIKSVHPRQVRRTTTHFCDVICSVII